MMSNDCSCQGAADEVKHTMKSCGTSACNLPVRWQYFQIPWCSSLPAAVSSLPATQKVVRVCMTLLSFSCGNKHVMPLACLLATFRGCSGHQGKSLLDRMGWAKLLLVPCGRQSLAASHALCVFNRSNEKEEGQRIAACNVAKRLMVLYADMLLHGLLLLAPCIMKITRNELWLKLSVGCTGPLRP